MDDMYVQRGTWQKTMQSSLDSYAAWSRQSGYELGPWFATAPLPSDAFATTHVDVNAVKLTAKGADGKRLWSQQRTHDDGATHRFGNRRLCKFGQLQRFARQEPQRYRLGIAAKGIQNEHRPAVFPSDQKCAPVGQGGILL